MNRLNTACSTAASLAARDILTDPYASISPTARAERHKRVDCQTDQNLWLLVNYIERATGTIEMEYTDYQTAVRSLCQVVREQHPKIFTSSGV